MAGLLTMPGISLQGSFAGLQLRRGPAPAARVSAAPAFHVVAVRTETESSTHLWKKESRRRRCVVERPTCLRGARNQVWVLRAAASCVCGCWHGVMLSSGRHASSRRFTGFAGTENKKTALLAPSGRFLGALGSWFWHLSGGTSESPAPRGSAWAIGYTFAAMHVARRGTGAEELSAQGGSRDKLGRSANARGGGVATKRVPRGAVSDLVGFPKTIWRLVGNTLRVHFQAL